MDLRQLENIRMIAETKSISKAAKKLYLTQSALNQQLIHLEEELGIQLFCRGRNHFQITEAGQIYLDGVNRILDIRKDVYNRISDLSQLQRGSIRLGLMADRGMSIFCSIYPHFYEKYPDIHLTPIEAPVSEQERMIGTGELDMGIITLPTEQLTRNNYTHIYKEELILIVPAAHPLAAQGARFTTKEALPELLPEISPKQFKNDPFILMQKTSTMRSLIDRSLEEAGFHPSIVMETRSSYSIFKMAQVMGCCSIIPRAYACPTKRLVYFSLPGHPSWDFVASHPKKIYLNEPCRYLIQLMKDYWSESPYLCDHKKEEDMD